MNPSTKDDIQTISQEIDQVYHDAMEQLSHIQLWKKYVIEKYIHELEQRKTSLINKHPYNDTHE